VNDYEILLMLDPELPEERQGEILTRTQELVTKNGGDWESQEPWGRRRLAYEIDHKQEGSYHLLELSTEPETLDEISRVLRITDGVIRHMPTRRITRRTTPVRAPAEGDRGEYAPRETRSEGAS